MPSPPLLPPDTSAAEVGAALNARQCPSAPFLSSLDRAAPMGRVRRGGGGGEGESGVDQGNAL